MRILSLDVANVHDEEAKLKGFLEIKRLSLYKEGDYPIPEDINIKPKPPCLILEVLDEEMSTKEIKIMKPIDWLPVTKEIIDFFKKHNIGQEEE